MIIKKLPESKGQTPQRIVCTVPSITELLFDLGLEDRIVGRTKFCIHPSEKVRKIQIVGGTKNLRIESIKTIKPDLIIANKEENTKSEIEELYSLFPTYISEVKTLQDALSMIEDIGQMTDTLGKAKEIVSEINAAKPATNSEFKSALYLIWKDPYMSIGGDTFISDMMTYAGFDNVMKDHKRYPALSDASIQDLNPDYILLSSEPYPFSEKHMDQIKEIAPSSHVQLVDGELYSWYGSKIIKAFRTFSQGSQGMI